MAVVEVEESLLEVMREQDLAQFQEKLTCQKQLTRLDHFQHVTDDELLSYGLSAPSVRRLRIAIAERRKKRAKAGKKEKMVVLGHNAPRESSGGPLVAESVHQSSTNVPSTSAPSLIARDEIKLMETLGEGTFAVVKRAVWRRPGLQPMDCAVKILHDMSEQYAAGVFN